MVLQRSRSTQLIDSFPDRRGLAFHGGPSVTVDALVDRVLEVGKSTFITSRSLL